MRDKMMGMICWHCARLNVDHAVFCGWCGRRVESRVDLESSSAIVFCGQAPLNPLALKPDFERSGMNIASMTVKQLTPDHFIATATYCPPQRYSALAG